MNEPIFTENAHKINSLRDLIFSDTMLEDILSLPKSKLIEIIPEMDNLDFLLTGKGISTRHKFTVYDHTILCLRTLSTILDLYNNDVDIDIKYNTSTNTKKLYFKRLVNLIREINIDTESEEYKALILSLLFHDLGKGSCDRSIEEIEAEKASKNLSMPAESMVIIHKQKDHEERGAHLVYNMLEEIPNISQKFVNLVKNLIEFHDDLSKLRVKKDFDFFVFLRRILDTASDYYFPIKFKDNMKELCVKILHLYYLMHLIDIYSVDGDGSLWREVGLTNESNFQKAKWIISQRANDLLKIVELVIDNFDIDNESKNRILEITNKYILQNYRFNDKNFNFYKNELSKSYSRKLVNRLLAVVKEFFEHTRKMPPQYLINTLPEEKLFHIEMLSVSADNYVFDFEKNDDKLKIIIIKKQAKAGSLLQIVKNLTYSDIEIGKILKIIELNAYSGLDDRIIDIYVIGRIDGQAIEEETVEIFKKNLNNLNNKNYEEKKLIIYKTESELEEMINSVSVEIGSVIEDNNEYLKLIVKNSFKLNYVLYQCLNTIHHINIQGVKIEPEDDLYKYIFLINKKDLKYHSISCSGYKRDLIENIKNNIIIK